MKGTLCWEFRAASVIFVMFQIEGCFVQSDLEVTSSWELQGKEGILPFHNRKSASSSINL